MKWSVVVALGLAVISTGAAPDWSQTPTFREAADQALGIVRVRVSGGDGTAPTLNVVEVIRGHDVPKTIMVSTELWNVHRPKPIPAGDVTYLVLLGTGSQLLCGHLNGLIIMSHSCIGIVPVVEDRIPAEYASRYSREAKQAIELGQVRKDLARRK